MHKEKVTRNKDYEWLLFPQSYLTSAIVLCDWLLKTYEFDAIAHSANSPPEQFFYRFHSPEYVIFPAVYNLKHGLELYLKALSRLCDGEYNDGSHDLKELLAELVGRIKKDRGVLDTLNNFIKDIVEKYYSGTYVPYTIKESVADCSNQAERYPEHNTYCLPDFFVFDNNKDVNTLITPELLREIRNDAEKSYIEFRKIQSELLKDV